MSFIIKNKKTVARIAVVGACVALLSGCSSYDKYDEIRPQFTDLASYEALGCNEISRQHSAVSSQLGTLQKQQGRAVTRDALGRGGIVAGFGLLGLLVSNPLSNLMGDHEGQIALSKGEEQALRSVFESKRCGG